MLKKQLRLDYRNKRKSLTKEQLQNASLGISNLLLTLPIWSFDYYHCFLSILENKEVDTAYLLSILQGKDKHILVPKIKSPSALSHFLLTDNTLFKKNSLHIAEPVDGIEISISKIDVVFIPLLAFDKRGNRVGYGKGYYDAFLSQCRTDVIKIGLSVFEAEESIEDVHQNDILLDYCVTPDKIYSFSSDA